MTAEDYVLEVKRARGLMPGRMGRAKMRKRLAREHDRDRANHTILRQNAELEDRRAASWERHGRPQDAAVDRESAEGFRARQGALGVQMQRRGRIMNRLGG